MKRMKRIGLLIALAICFTFSVFAASPAVHPGGGADLAQKSVSKAAAAAFDFSGVQTGVLPSRIETATYRRFYGFRASRTAQKIPIRKLRINAIGRRAPDFVPLN